MQCLQQVAYCTKLATLIISFICVLFSDVQAQSAGERAAAGIPQIAVGTKVPPEFWTQEHLVYVNGDTIRTTLEYLKGKPFILDFWATWCGTCIQKFAGNTRLEKTLNNEMVFVLVNSDFKYDNIEKIGRVLSDTSHFGGVEGTSIVFDSYLKTMFPHKAIPQYIWICDRGRVRAITSFDLATTDNMEIIIDRKKGVLHE